MIDVVKSKLVFGLIRIFLPEEYDQENQPSASGLLLLLVSL